MPPCLRDLNETFYGSLGSFPPIAQTREIWELKEEHVPALQYLARPPDFFQVDFHVRRIHYDELVR